MLVDLHHDRLVQTPVTQISDVQAAIIFNSDRFERAGRAVGLTPAEYQEMERMVLDGQVQHGMMPLAVESMAGMSARRGVYALRGVQVHRGEPAFVIALHNGTRIYVPQVCGNLSVVHGKPPVIAHVKKRHYTPYRPPVAYTPPAPPVQQPPVQQPPLPPPVVAAAPPPVVTAVATSKKRAFPLVPFFAWLSGGVNSIVTNSPQTPVVPACNTGSLSDTHVCSQ